MVLRNKKTGEKFSTTMADYESKIVAKGLAGKYEIVEDSKPVELKQLSVELHKKKQNAKQ